jgi:hypothetical protein
MVVQQRALLRVLKGFRASPAPTRANLSNASMRRVGTKLGTGILGAFDKGEDLSKVGSRWRHHPNRAVAKLAANPAALLLPVDYSVRRLLRQRVRSHRLSQRSSMRGRESSQTIAPVVADGIRWRLPISRHDRFQINGEFFVSESRR